MATEQRVLDISLEAGEDLSSYQYHFVVRDASTGKAVLLDAADEDVEGILQNAPESGEAAAIRVIGDSKLVANGVLAVGKLVKPEYVSGTDCGKGEDAGPLWEYARGIVLESAGAEDDLCTVRLIGPFPKGQRYGLRQIIVTSESTADNHTYTAAELLGGLIIRDPNGGPRFDPTDTAANIIAAIKQAGVGNAFEFTIKNAADAAETITVTAGTGVTLTGTMTIAQNNSKRFLCVVTASTTVTIYSLGTVVH
jgi:hypothetical protein